MLDIGSQDREEPAAPPGPQGQGETESNADADYRRPILGDSLDGLVVKMAVGDDSGQQRKPPSTEYHADIEPVEDLHHVDFLDVMAPASRAQGPKGLTEQSPGCRQMDSRDERKSLSGGPQPLLSA